MTLSVATGGEDPNSYEPVKDEDIPVESSPYGILPLKLKRNFIEVAELAAKRLLRTKQLDSPVLNYRTVQTYDYNFRVKIFDEKKLRHSILVKMKEDYSVKEIIFDH